jgi:transcriptional regulator with XRE-family HTH domain
VSTDLLITLGRAIRELRTERNISQERLSLDSGVHRNYIGGIERAERQPTITTIAVLAQTLGVRPSELVERAEAISTQEHPEK